MSVLDIFGDEDELAGEAIGLGEEDQKKVRSSGNDEWFKAEQRSYRAAFVYFQPAHIKALSMARAKDPDLNKKEFLTALAEKRAEKLGKTVDSLTPVDWLDTNTCQFRKVSAYYKEGVEGLGYVAPPKDLTEEERQGIWNKHLGDSSDHICTVIVLYPTDRAGNIVDIQAVVRESQVIRWRFGAKVYQTIAGQNNSLRSNGISMAGQDFVLKCTNAKFKHFEVTAAGPAIYKKNPKFMASVLDRAVKLYPKLNPFRVLTTAQLLEKLGVGGGAVGQETNVSSSDIDDMFAGM